MKKNGFNQEDAVFISQLACYRNDTSHIALAQGSPLSPFLSNSVSTPVDSFFIKYVNNHNDVIYSRYADDIVLSTDSNVTRKEIENDYDFIKESLHNRQFELNDDKYNHFSKGRKLVGGIKVNEKLNVNKSLIDEMKLNLHYAQSDYYRTRDEYCKKHSVKKNTDKLDLYFKESIIGKINYISLVRGENDHIVRALKKRFNCISEFKYTFDLRNSMEKAVLPIEYVIVDADSKDECPYNGTIFNTKYGLITCYHNFFEYKDKYNYHTEFVIKMKNRTCDIIKEYRLDIEPKVIRESKKTCDPKYNNYFDEEHDIAFISKKYLEEHLSDYHDFIMQADYLELQENINFYQDDFCKDVETYGYSNYKDTILSLNRIGPQAKYTKDYRFYSMNGALGEGASGGPVLYEGKVIGVYNKGHTTDANSEAKCISSILNLFNNES